MAQNLLETGVQKEYPVAFQCSGNFPWAGTESLKPSKGINTFTGNEPTGRGDVFVPKTNTSAPFSGGTFKDTPPPKAPEPVFKGFKDLTTRIVEQLKGHGTVSRQYIRDLTNQEGIKQAERDMVRKVLDQFADGKVRVTDFANKVRTELLPLKVKDTAEITSPHYESIILPSEIRGPVADYTERIYESPIATSAGDIHFPNLGTDVRTGKVITAPNYFAHTRVEDLPGSKRGKTVADRDIDDTTQDVYTGEYYKISHGTTRRVIELQSDLFQKGRLENEAGVLSTEPDLQKYTQAHTDRALEISRHEPYRNTWHERIIREEVKQAALDGKTKLQFPTGETAMKIEGLAERQDWVLSHTNDRGFTIPGVKLTEDNLKVGQQVYGHGGQEWVITDILGNGKFKAVTKRNVPLVELDFIRKLKEQGIDLSPEEYQRRLAIQLNDQNIGETFDISGKTDPENPIFKFYEKEVGRYLTNKYGAQRVTDAQGVTWWEIPVKKEYARSPIEAFGIAPLLNGNDQ